ncbi:MAG: folate family ECF transporter S component [Acutalibacteraceae bacterium]|nr:folate family ECF transporter S component [Clostridia bacterium]MEE1128077.1 folate family ECF transporter S component [Acutalibacteraceae bacterium]
MKDFLKSRFTLRNLKLFDIIIFAMLISLEIVFDRFLVISAWNIKISLGFLPTALIAYRYGCLGGMIVAALSDFIGAILFPFGPYFVGFTLTAALTGIIFGLFLYRNNKILNTLFATFINSVLCTLLLNSLCISFLYGADFKAVMVSRIPQLLIITFAQIVTFNYLNVFDLAFKRLPNKQKIR